MLLDYQKQQDDNELTAKQTLEKSNKNVREGLSKLMLLKNIKTELE